MSELKELFEDLGFSDVVTYIQSGNVIFKTKLEVEESIKKIEHAIDEKYNFKVSVIIRTLAELKEVLTNNPFTNYPETKKMNFTFLSRVPDYENVKSLSELDYNPDIFRIIGKEIYLYLNLGAGKTKLTNNLLENKLKLKATSRNWNTLNKLIELVQK